MPELSDAAVRKLRHRGAKAAAYAVGGVSGLLLVRKPPVKAGEAIGARSWILQVMVGSKRRDIIGLGGYPTVGLAQARQRAREAREKIWHGVDPLVERKALKSALMAEQGKQVAFAELAREYITKKSRELEGCKAGAAVDHAAFLLRISRHREYGSGRH